MSDEDYDEESFRAYENELYGEKSSESEIDSEIEEALYSQVHYSFSLPNEEDLDEKGADSSDGACSPALLETKVQDDKEYQDNPNGDEDSAEKIDYIVIDEESCSSYNRSGNTSNQEDNSGDDDDDDDDNNSGEATGSTGLKEDWSLIKEDLKSDSLADGKRRPVSRYYKKEGNFRCHNCNEKGHKASDCPTPKKISCFLCGGEHTRRKCPNELCFNCHEPGHRVMNCKQPRSRPSDQCHRCFMLGHFSKDCPDRWRQYHRTTDPKKQPVVSRSGEFTGPVYCYNCSEEGHYGHECIEERMDIYMAPTYPFVVKYDGDPEEHRMQDKSRKRTKTHDGTVSQSREGNSKRTKKQKRRNEERRSWPNHRHGHHDNRRIDKVEEVTDDRGGIDTPDGRVGDFIERISERTKKQQRGKGTTHQNSNTSEGKIGSKRKHGGTPHHGSKKGRQDEDNMNEQKKKKRKEKYSPSASHERKVELVRDDEVYSNDYQNNQQKRHKNKKFNKHRESLPDAFTRMVDDWEEKDTSHHHRHSFPGYTHNKSHLSPAYDRHQSQGSPHRQYKFKHDKRSSKEYHGKPFNNSRGFRSKWK